MYEVGAPAAPVGWVQPPFKAVKTIADRFPQPVNGPFTLPKDKIIVVKLYHDNGMR